VAEGNLLDRVLRAAPMFDQLERAMNDESDTPTRFDLRLYREHADALQALVDRSVERRVDFAQLNAREFLRARALDPQVRPLIHILPMPGVSDAAVIFARKETGIGQLSDLRGKSFLMGTENSTMTFWAKVNLAEAGVRGRDLNGIRYIDRMVDVLPDHSARKANALGNPFSSMTAVEAVVAGKYDAGVVRERRFREVAAEKGLVALAKFSDTGDLLVARGNLPIDVANAFQRLMLSLKDSSLNQPLLNSPARFKAAVNVDFDTMASKLPAEAAFEE